MIIPFTIKIPAGTTTPAVITSYEFKQDAVLTKLYLDIPSGWNFTAGVQFVFNDGEVIPSKSADEEYLTGEASSYEFAILKDVKKGDSVSIVGINLDPANVDHFCEVIFEVLTPKQIENYRDLLWGRR